ncbi:bis(5'-adenosyl)-triphosphatase [Diutina catenulata]
MADVYFHKFLVNSQVFFRSRYTYALVNLRPLVPGHVLVVPLRTSVLRLGDLSLDESVDYMNTVQIVHKFIAETYSADSLNIAIQDGPESGQSVPHLHTHIIPRYKADGWGDNIYKDLESSDMEEQYREFFARKKHWKTTHDDELDQSDDERHNRTEAEMAKEATWLGEKLQVFFEKQMRQREQDQMAVNFDFDRIYSDKSY